MDVSTALAIIDASIRYELRQRYTDRYTRIDRYLDDRLIWMQRRDAQ